MLGACPSPKVWSVHDIEYSIIKAQERIQLDFHTWNSLFILKIATCIFFHRRQLGNVLITINIQTLLSKVNRATCEKWLSK